MTGSGLGDRYQAHNEGRATAKIVRICMCELAGQQLGMLSWISKALAHRSPRSRQTCVVM